MKQVSDDLLRHFLLGTVNDEQRQDVEVLLLTDSAMRDRVFAAEQDLIEDYLEDSLTAEEKRRFLLLYAQTPAQQRQLRITRSIKGWAVTQAGLTQASTPKITNRNRWRDRLRLKTAFVIPIAVTAMIVIVIAALWLHNRTERNRRLATQQELAQLNSPASLRETPPGMSSLELSPVTVRSGEHASEIKRRADIQVFQLRLPWVRGERYPTYRAEIRRVDGDDSFTAPDLEPETDGQYSLRLRVPADALRRGQYQILLTGIIASGAAGLTEEYTFTVTD